MNWRTIKDFTDYQISDTGVVKSIQRKVNRFNGNILHEKTINERFLKPSLNGKGYAFVCLRKDKKHHNKRIHQLVAENFLNTKKDGLVVHHKDGDKLNNNVSNLEYTSMQNNTKQYYKSIGKSMGKVPITHIPTIINRINNGEACFKIAKEYNVTRNDIAVLSKIVALTGEELTLKENE